MTRRVHALVQPDHPVARRDLAKVRPGDSVRLILAFCDQQGESRESAWFEVTLIGRGFILARPEPIARYLDTVEPGQMGFHPKYIAEVRTADQMYLARPSINGGHNVVH